MSIAYVAVLSNGVTRYASLAEFLASISGLPAAFSSAKTGTGVIAPRPTKAQFNAASAAAAKTTSATATTSSALDALETRIAILEGKRHAPEFVPGD